MKKEQTLDNLPDADKQELEKMKTPKEGQKYLGLYYADGTKFDESSKINNDIELHIKFENIKTEEPATPSNNNVKDATPKTGTVDMIGYATILAIVSAMGIVILNKKH